VKKLQYCIFTKRPDMIIERTSKEVVFRLPSSTKLEDLQEIANLFAFKEISSKSKATQKDVDDLVKKVKKGRWANTKKRLGL
jgi:exoribonuclease R